MAQVVTPEQRAQYNATRKAKYANSPELKALRKQRNATPAAHEGKAAYNAARREQRRTDPEYRKMCNERSKRRPKHKTREHQLWSHYRLTVAQYESLLLSQGGKCAICGAIPHKSFHVDHCHNTSKVRGLLCGGCNVGLGCYGDDPERMQKAIDYLKAHKCP